MATLMCSLFCSWSPFWICGGDNAAKCWAVQNMAPAFLLQSFRMFSPTRSKGTSVAIFPTTDERMLLFLGLLNPLLHKPLHLARWPRTKLLHHTDCQESLNKNLPHLLAFFKLLGLQKVVLQRNVNLHLVLLLALSFEDCFDFEESD